MVSVDTLEDNKAFAEKEHADGPDAHRAAGVEFHTLRTSRPVADALIGFLRHRAEDRRTSNIQHRTSNVE